VDVVYPVRYYGHVRSETGPDGRERRVWEGGEVVMAVAYDNPIPGFDTFNTINLRLFRAMPSREFDLASFNTGDYMRAVEQRQRAETITSVLYPSDATYSGKELRLKQQYFFVAATLRDVIRRFKRMPGWEWRRFAEKNALQLNDTHPTIAIPELMRVLVDEEGISWDEAWGITRATFGYTNHTVLPEALEKWSVDLLGSLLPRHLEIIYTINWHHLEAVRARFGGDDGVMGRLSLVEEGGMKMIRMANLGIVGSHAVNGVAELHSDLLKSDVFPEFFRMFPERFCNKTNGVTPRRWINQCNPGLSAIITKWLDSEDWLKHLDMLGSLRSVADTPELQREWAAVKQANKARLARVIERDCGVRVRPDALFDVQVKRIHEYKRQQMNALYCIHRYTWIKSLTLEQRAAVVPRVTIFGGKAAPAYEMAKRFIRLIHRIGAVVNNDPEIGDLFKVVFLPNYNVSLAEIIIPANDLSQHISTAGMEASGTSNMKFAMNGGLIIGTMDGANVEIAQEIDADNMFIFGALAPEVAALRADRRSKPARPYAPELQSVLDLLASGKFGPMDDVGAILNTLRWENDWYLVGHDFPLYCKAQEEVDRVYRDRAEWTRRTILSVAGMGKFSTDRTITEYAREIWNISACSRPRPVTDAMGRARSFPALMGMDGSSVPAVAGASPAGAGKGAYSASGGSTGSAGSAGAGSGSGLLSASSGGTSPSGGPLAGQPPVGMDFDLGAGAEGGAGTSVTAVTNPALAGLLAGAAGKAIPVAAASAQPKQPGAAGGAGATGAAVGGGGKGKKGKSTH